MIKFHRYLDATQNVFFFATKMNILRQAITLRQLNLNNFYFVLTYLLTYSMVRSPAWEANWFEASQEIPRISRNPKLHYRTHKRPPPVSNLGQPNPVHIHTSWRSTLKLSTHLRLGLPSGLFPSGFPTKTLYNPSPHQYAPHARPIWFFSILSTTQNWVRRTNHLAPPYAITSIPQSPRPS